MSIFKQAVRAAFNDFVPVNRTLVKHFKDSNPALFLGYLIQEDKYLEEQNKLDQYGFFYCKTKKLEDKYGFSYKVQDRLIGILVDAGAIDIVLKRVEGSENISKVKHFKINHENVANLVTGKPISESKTEDSELPEDLLAIHNTLKKFAEDHRAKYQTTGADLEILEIAKLHGLCPAVINESIKERHKRMKGKIVTAKYLLTAFIPNISEWENTPEEELEKTRLLLKVC
jgi:hypothetical protein